MGRFKSLGLLKSFFPYAFQLSGASIPFFWFLTISWAPQQSRWGGVASSGSQVLFSLLWAFIHIWRPKLLMAVTSLFSGMARDIPFNRGHRKPFEPRSLEGSHLVSLPAGPWHASVLRRADAGKGRKWLFQTEAFGVDLAEELSLGYRFLMPTSVLSFPRLFAQQSCDGPGYFPLKWCVVLPQSSGEVTPN